MPIFYSDIPNIALVNCCAMPYQYIISYQTIPYYTTPYITILPDPTNYIIPYHKIPHFSTPHVKHTISYHTILYQTILHKPYNKRPSYTLYRTLNVLLNISVTESSDI